MNAHFSSFTPESMRAFGQDLAADFQRRTEFLKDTREHTFTMLAGFRRDHQGAEKNRRQRAEREVDARRLFMSELKSGVHALLGRFELSRKEVAGDLQEMASELRAARDAFRNRPGRQGGFFRRGGQQPKQTQPSASGQPLQAARSSWSTGAPRETQPSASGQPLQAAAEAQDGSKARSGAEAKPGHSKKPHG